MERNPFTDSDAVWAIGFILVGGGMLFGVIGLIVLLVGGTR